MSLRALWGRYVEAYERYLEGERVRAQRLERVGESET